MNEREKHSNKKNFHRIISQTFLFLMWYPLYQTAKTIIFHGYHVLN